eukprot:g24595.t1
MNKGQSKQLDCGKGKLIHGKKGEETCGEKENGKEVKKESIQDKEPQAEFVEGREARKTQEGEGAKGGVRKGEVLAEAQVTVQEAGGNDEKNEKSRTYFGKAVNPDLPFLWSKRPGSRGPQGKYIFDARYGREVCPGLYCFPKALTKYGDFESGESCRFTDPENSQNQSSKVFGAWFVRTRADGYIHSLLSSSTRRGRQRPCLLQLRERMFLSLSNQTPSARQSLTVLARLSIEVSCQSSIARNLTLATDHRPALKNVVAIPAKRSKPAKRGRRKKKPTTAGEGGDGQTGEGGDGQTAPAGNGTPGTPGTGGNVTQTATHIAAELVKGMKPLFDGLVAQKESDHNQFEQLKGILEAGNKALSGIQSLVEKQSKMGSDSDESENSDSPMQVLYASAPSQYSQMAMSLPMVPAFPQNQAAASYAWPPFGSGVTQGIPVPQPYYFPQELVRYHTPPHSAKSHGSHSTKRAAVHTSKHSLKKKRH